jgi:SAM-dependent methyltransferase
MNGDPARDARVGHYDAQYGHFLSETFSRVRAEAFGEDFGQNGWQTAAELERFIAGLALGPGSRLLDVACGSGGPALRIAQKSGSSVVGVDLHADGTATARQTAKERGLEEGASFLQGDASRSGCRSPRPQRRSWIDSFGEADSARASVRQRNVRRERKHSDASPAEIERLVLDGLHPRKLLDQRGE